MIRKLKRKVKGLWLQRKKFELDDVVLLISSPRGGSTWLCEIMNHIPHSVINWEPFHPDFGILPEDFQGGDSIFIPETDANADDVKNVSDTLTCKRSTPFTLSFATIRQIKSSQIVITKSVRTTALIPWMTAQLNLKRKPIYLLRHPVPTAFSHLKAFDDERDLAVFDVPKQKNNQRFKKHEGFLNNLKSKLERQIAIWCLNNLPTLNHPRHGKDWEVVYYEDLVLHPKAETHRIFKCLGFSEFESLIDQIEFEKPSQTDLKGDLEKEKTAQLKKWQSWLSEEEKKRIQDIFDYFDLALYNINDFLPVKNS